MNNGTIATARTRNVVRTPNQAESFVTELVSEPNSHAVPQARKIIAGASHNPGCPNSGLKASSQINANTDPIKIAAESSLCESNPKPPIARNKKHVRDQRASSGQQSTSEKHKPQTIQAKDSLQDLGHFWNFWRFLGVSVAIHWRSNPFIKIHRVIPWSISVINDPTANVFGEQSTPEILQITQASDLVVINGSGVVSIFR